MLTVYTKENCEYCLMAKTVLAARNIPYTEKTLGIDFLREDIVKDFPHMRTFPIIVDSDGTVIGGHKELLEQLNKGNTFGKVMLNE